MDDTDGTWMLGGEPLEPNYDRGHWTTRDGVRLEIKEMETSHIKNTINLLKRRLNNLEDYEDDCYEYAYGYSLSYYFKCKIQEFEEELRVREVYKKHVLGDKYEL